jgi:polyhydroxybutyrate depolymerase
MSNGNEGGEVDRLVGTPIAPSGEIPSSEAAGAEAPPAPERSSGCGQPAPANGEQTLTIDGVERTFLLDLPDGYDPNVALPLVFGFHGATTSAMSFRSAFYGNLLSAMSDEAIVVHPDALGDPTAWNNQADVPFFDAMLARLEQTVCVDQSRVFATGHSSGGFFSNTLGCQRGDVLRAIAPVSAGGPFGGGAGCTGEVAVFLAHGENDMTVPFTTGEASRDGWLGRNGCEAAETAATASPAADVECIDYGGCGDGLPVSWCVHQEGHSWADFLPEAIWGFFSSL